MEGKAEPRAYEDTSFALNSTSANCCRLPLSHDRIFLVDNTQSLKECMRVLCVVCIALFSFY